MNKTARIGGIVAAVVLLYVLALGPATRVNLKFIDEHLIAGDPNPDASLERALATEKFIDTVWAPVYWPALRWRPAGDALQWYLNLWWSPPPVVEVEGPR